MSEHDLRTYLAENPRLNGVLFLMVLLLTQAQPLMFGGAVVHPGP